MADQAGSLLTAREAVCAFQGPSPSPQAGAAELSSPPASRQLAQVFLSPASQEVARAGSRVPAIWSSW